MMAILNTNKGCFTRSVSVAELENRLSKYLALAKRKKLSYGTVIFLWRSCFLFLLNRRPKKSCS
jgi:hypothetical protein